MQQDKHSLLLSLHVCNTWDFFEIGAKVYFKQNIDKKWCGPGQGAILYKAHCSRTQLITDFEYPPTFDTINLPANNDNLQTGKTLQKTNPDTINLILIMKCAMNKPVKVMKLLMKI